MHKCVSERDGFCTYPRGRVLGGSSTINGMMYVRGHQKDFDNWSDIGCSGWSYKEVLPYFIMSENATEPDLTNSIYHGTSGNLNVQYSRYKTPLREEYIKAGLEFGWQKRDYNGRTMDNSIYYLQSTLKGPSRDSTSKAYLLPIMGRKNLHILQQAVVSKIIIDKTIATGIEYYKDGKKSLVYANKELIISAGSINTPKLLMSSGIGPSEELLQLNIDIVADLPVGKNLQDHPMVPLVLKLNTNYTIRTDVWRTNDSIMQYVLDGQGPLTTHGGEVMLFFNPLNESEPSSFQVMFFSAFPFEKSKDSVICALAALVHPESRGSVKLNSTDLSDPPLIDTNYFGEQVDFDIMEEGFVKVFEFLKTPTMSKYAPEVDYSYIPNCNGYEDRELIRCIISQYSRTIFHPVSTARMGDPEDTNAVVTPNLMVRGFQNLRVIDASVMPVVPRANTNAPTIMIAEKGADIIKSIHKTGYLTLIDRIKQKLTSMYESFLN